MDVPGSWHGIGATAVYATPSSFIEIIPLESTHKLRTCTPRRQRNAKFSTAFFRFVPKNHRFSFDLRHFRITVSRLDCLRRGHRRLLRLCRSRWPGKGDCVGRRTWSGTRGCASIVVVRFLSRMPYEPNKEFPREVPHASICPQFWVLPESWCLEWHF